MSLRTVPEKIRDFLLACSGRNYCDDCVQQRLGLKWRQQVQVITATLAVTDSFVRETGTCSNCNEKKQVIRTAQASADTNWRSATGDRSDHAAALHPPRG